MKKLNLAKLRPEVEIFGKKYRLPTVMSKLTENPDQGLAIREIIENAYPDIEKPEVDMIFIYLLKESKFENGKPVIQDKNSVTIDGKKYEVSLNDIIRIQQSEYEYCNVKYRFRVPSSIEYHTSGCGNPGQVARKYFVEAEHEGEIYSGLDSVGGDIPMAIAENAQKIIGDIRLVLSDGNYITGYEKIVELLLTKKI